MNGIMLEAVDGEFSVCKVDSIDGKHLLEPFCFIGRTDEELSLVCLTEKAPEKYVGREDGWRCFRIRGVLDFSLVGILAPIARILADENIGIFAVSTYNTDYVLVRREQLQRALAALEANGYGVCR